MPEPRPLVFAVPKGRVLKVLSPLLIRAGLDPAPLLADDRRLIREEPTTGTRFLLLKPDDVPTYVEYGAADIGIVGRDVLLEREYDLYAPIDLGIGRCRLVVAGPEKARENPSGPGQVRAGRPLRVATKFPAVAQRHFASKGRQIESIFVQGSVELAPLTGLADVIVDLVESGETLRQNGLVEIETIADVSSVVVVNRAALKLETSRIRSLLSRLEGATA
ncbi:MAG: ATP phosphoribosyltransferase [Deltaproteobacteria bacterium]|nr:MAG: ATP phosphoribosyltransferase [Deltaproteobacteria bacterium]